MLKTRDDIVPAISSGFMDLIGRSLSSLAPAWWAVVRARINGLGLSTDLRAMISLQWPVFGTMIQISARCKHLHRAYG